MDKQQAFQIWESFFGDKQVAYDFASHPMKKEDFQNRQSHYGWDIDLKKPFLNRMDNYLPCSLNTIGFRQGKPTFKVGNNLFEIRKGKVYGTFSIFDITDRNHPINCDPTSENQDPEYNRARFHSIAVSYRPERVTDPRVNISISDIFDNALNEFASENASDEYSDDEENESEESYDEENSEEESDEYSEEESEDEVEEESMEEEEEYSTQESDSAEEESEEYADSDDEVSDDETEEEEEESESEILEDETAEESDEYSEETESTQDVEEPEEQEEYSDDEEIQEESSEESDQEEQSQEENQTEQHDFEDIIAANHALKEKIAILTIEAEQNQNRIKELTEEKETLNYELEMNKEANEDLSKSLNEAQNRLSEDQGSQNEEITALRNQLEEEKRKTEELQNRLSSFENATFAQTENHEDDLSSLKNELDSISAEKNHLASDNEMLLREKESLQQQLISSRQHEEEIQKQLDNLTQEDKTLKASYNQLDAQSEMIDDQIAVLNQENAKLLKKEEDNRLQIEELTKRCENLTMELDRANISASEGDGAKEALRKAQSERDIAIEDKKRSEARTTTLNDKLIEMQNELAAKETQYTQEKAAINAELKQKNDTIESLQKERDDSIRKILFINYGGDENSYDIFQSYVEANFMEFNADNIQSILIAHPEWKKQENIMVGNIHGESMMVDSEIIPSPVSNNERREKARNFYAEIYGEDKTEISDFAGRYIRLNDFENKNSEYGWDYALINPDGEEVKDNVFIANLKSIKDYKFNQVFESNGHSYQTISQQGKYKISSADFITDPYDFTEALRVSKNNVGKISPLIYLFVKAVGINTSEPNQESLMELFDILDRTVKRCCPTSFIEMKTVVGAGKGNYAFITFDGAQDEAYREVLDYAMLLNSYRREFRKQEKLNAVIVLNEVDVSFSKRHLDYDALLAETRDDELRALRYEFNMTVINSLIKRTIHIGPRILDKLPLDQNLLKPSQIGQGNFAKMYRFNQEFKVYNYVYSLSFKEEETE